MRRLALVAVLAAVAFTAAGCGFTPLYATPGVSANLSAIQIVAPDGHVAFMVREDLDDALGKDKDSAPKYRLNFTVAQARDPRGLTSSNYNERYETQVTVSYTLTDTATGSVVHTGQVFSQVSYDDANSSYAGIAAREDTQRRAASDAARRIQVDLAAFMAKQARG